MTERKPENLRIQLEYWRKRRGLTVAALAREAGVSTRTIHQIEHEGKNTIRADRAESLARALKISVDELIIDISETTQPAA